MINLPLVQTHISLLGETEVESTLLLIVVRGTLWLVMEAVVVVVAILLVVGVISDVELMKMVVVTVRVVVAMVQGR